MVKKNESKTEAQPITMEILETEIMDGAELDAADKIIAHLEGRLECVETRLEQCRWIPVSERLPDNSKRVEVFYLNTYGKKRVTCAEHIAYWSVLAEDFLSDECNESFYESEYDKENDVFWTPEGWYESNYHTDMNMFISDKILLWKPIILPTESKE